MMDDNLITPSDFFHRGMEYLETGKFSKALECFEGAIEREYHSPDIHIPMGEALFEIGRVDDALKQFKAASGGNPNEVLLWKGICYLELGRLRRAISAFNRILDNDPDHAEAHFKRAMALLELNEPDRALEGLNQSLGLLKDRPDTAPLQAEVMVWKARAMNRMDRRDEAFELLLQAHNTSPEMPAVYNEIGDWFRIEGALHDAKEWYLKGLGTLPEDPSLHNDYGNLLREMGKFEDSLKHLNLAIQYDANRSVVYYNRALTLERLGRLDEACKDYEVVIDNNSVDVDARLRKIDLLITMGLFVDANEDLDALNDSQKQRADVRETRARLLNRQAAKAEYEDDIDRAIQCLAEAIDISPDFLDLELPWHRDDTPRDRISKLVELTKDRTDDLGRLLHALGRFFDLRMSRKDDDKDVHQKAANEVLERLSAIDATDRYRAIAQRHVSELCFYDLDDIDRALEASLASLGHEPEYISALWMHATVLREGFDKPKEALEFYLKILGMTVQNSTMHLQIGDVYFDLGQPQRALAHYRAALFDRPGDLSIQTEIGHCMLALGRHADALHCFSRLESMGGASVDVMLNMAEAYLAMGDRTECAQYLEKAEETNAGLDPVITRQILELRSALENMRDNPKNALKVLEDIAEDDLSTFGQLQQGKAHATLEQFAEAEKILKEIITPNEVASPDVLGAIRALSRNYFSQNRMDDAIAQIDRVIALAPLDEAAYRMKSWMQMMKGDFDASNATDEIKKLVQQVGRVYRLLVYEEFAEAATVANDVVNEYPDRAESYYYRACARAQIADEDNAIDDVRHVLKLDPDCRERLLDEFYLEPLRLRDRIEFREP